MFAQTYSAGRWLANPARTVTSYLNSLPDDEPVVTQQLGLARQLRPFLDRADRLQVAGGRARASRSAARPVGGRAIPICRGARRQRRLPGSSGSVRSLSRRGCHWTSGASGCATARNARRSPASTGGIALETAQVSERLPSDGYLPVTLFWSTEQPLARDYTVFVHVVGPDGQMVGQWDQTPAAGKAPTSGWEPGRLVADEYRVPVQAGVGKDPYRVYVGIYDPATGTRLDVSSANPVSERRLLVQTIRPQ